MENRYIDLSSYKTPEIIEPMVSENSCGELHVLQKERIRRNGAKTVRLQTLLGRLDNEETISLCIITKTVTVCLSEIN